MGVQNPPVRMFFQPMEPGESSRNGEILQESSTKSEKGASAFRWPLSLRAFQRLGERGLRDKNRLLPFMS
jgi:hypothetical protein